MLRAAARLLTLLVVFAAVAIPASARSGEPASSENPREQARELGERAINAINKGKHEEAVELLHQAEELFHAPTHLLFMARAYVELGRLVEAHDAYQAVVSETIPDYAPAAFHDAKQTARQELAALRKRLPTVQVTVRGAPSNETQVTVDGAAVAPEKLAGPIALAPGGHVIEATAAGVEPVRRRVELKAGDVTQRIELVLGGGAGEPDDRHPESEPGSEDAGGASPWMVTGVVALSVGAAGLGVGIVTGALTLSQASDIQDNCVDGHCPPDQEDDASTTRTLGDVSTAAFIIGGVVAAAGIILLIASTEDDESSEETASEGSLRLLLTPAGVGLVGVF